MNTLTIEKFLKNETDLIFEAGETTLSIEDGILTIAIDFPAKYTGKEQVWDEAGNNVLSEPIDFGYKEDDATLELEMPIENAENIDDLLNRTININSETDDDLTNFLIMNNHHPTFDDTITLKKVNDEYILEWKGFVPDINYYDFEKSMQKKFPFILITKCEIS